MKRTIITADTMGFCTGVKRAIEKLDAAASRGPCASFGPLIHNPTVLEYFQNRGVVCITKPDQAEPGMQLIIRAHGIPRGVQQELLSKNVVLIDGTCPRVIRSEKLVARYSTAGWTVVLTGDHSHGEVEAVRSYGDDVHVVNSVADLEGFTVTNRIFLLSQTTFSSHCFQEIASILKGQCREAGVEFKEQNTICPATDRRQQALEDLMGKVDGIVVVGGKKSSNTRRLYEKALSGGLRAWHIETEHDVIPEMAQCSQLGLTAGASTPDEVIERVRLALQQL